MTNSWIDKLKSTPEGRRLLEQERLVVEVTDCIASLMEQENVCRSELARRIGKSPAFITKILRGSNNFTLRTLSDVLFALGRSARISLGEIGESVEPIRVAPKEPIQLAPSWKLKPRRKERSSEWEVLSPINGDGDNQSLAA